MSIQHLNIIEVSPKYLYHTTTIYNKKSKAYWKETVEFAEEDYPITYPNYNDFHHSLHPRKAFTITQYCDFNSPWMKYDYIFLRYKLKKPIKLIDDRNGLYCRTMLIDMVNENNIDGFIQTNDCFSITLMNPSNCLNEKFKIIPFTSCKHNHEFEWDHLDYIKYEKKLTPAAKCTCPKWDSCKCTFCKIKNKK
jgi:hypothetical protein